MELVVQSLPNTRNGNILHSFYLYKTVRDNCIRLYSTCLNSTEYKKCYNILDVKVDSDQETVRQAFLKLVKRFHPDSGSSEADAEKFQEIEKAYRKLQQKFHAERWTDRWNEDAGEYGLYYNEKKKKSDTPVVQLDIKHTAPQHRQYLSYDGFGVGTPAQRHKQYQRMRASTAIENVYNHRVTKIQEAETLDAEQALVVKDKQRAKNIKTRYGMDRLVEDLIQESMARGDFDNLSGKGKPLSTKQDHHNPYVDLVTHKLNQVMIDNGFMPEWIMLQKEIREDVQRLKERLQQAKDRLSLSSLPLSASDTERWATALEDLREDVRRVNSKIGKFNLVVPLLPNQMLQFDLDKEGQRILVESQTTTSSKPKAQEKQPKTEGESLIGLFMSVFGR